MDIQIYSSFLVDLGERCGTGSRDEYVRFAAAQPDFHENIGKALADPDIPLDLVEYVLSEAPFVTKEDLEYVIKHNCCDYDDLDDDYGAYIIRKICESANGKKFEVGTDFGNGDTILFPAKNLRPKTLKTCVEKMTKSLYSRIKMLESVIESLSCQEAVARRRGDNDDEKATLESILAYLRDIVGKSA